MTYVNDLQKKCLLNYLSLNLARRPYFIIFIQPVESFESSKFFSLALEMKHMVLSNTHCLLMIFKVPAFAIHVFETLVSIIYAAMNSI